MACVGNYAMRRDLNVNRSANYFNKRRAFVIVYARFSSTPLVSPENIFMINRFDENRVFFAYYLHRRSTRANRNLMRQQIFI